MTPSLSPSEHRGTGAQRMLRVEPRQLLAHQVPLVQERPIHRRQLVHAEQRVFLHPFDAVERLANLCEHAQPLAVARTPRERKPLDVPRQSHPRGQHDVSVRTRSVEPANAAIR